MQSQWDWRRMAKSLLSGYARLPYNAFIYLSTIVALSHCSSSLLSLALHVPLTRFPKFRRRTENNDADEFGRHPPVPPNSSINVTAIPPRHLSILSFLPLEGVSRPTPWDLSAKISLLSHCSAADSVWYRHYANWSATPFDIVVALTTKLWKLSWWPNWYRRRLESEMAAWMYACARPVLFLRLKFVWTS